MAAERTFVENYGGVRNARQVLEDMIPHRRVHGASERLKLYGGVHLNVVPKRT